MPPEDRSQTPTGLSEEEEKRLQAALAELNAEWDRRLACLQRPDFAERVDAIFEAQGRTTVRPKAGETF